MQLVAIIYISSDATYNATVSSKLTATKFCFNFNYSERRQFLNKKFSKPMFAYNCIMQGQSTCSMQVTAINVSKISEARTKLHEKLG